MFIAHYWRYFGQYTEEFETLDEALSFLHYGVDDGYLATDQITDELGNVLMNEKQIFEHYCKAW